MPIVKEETFKREGDANAPQFGTRGTDTLTFDIPPGERYERAAVAIIQSRHNGGARITSQPTPGETGRGKTVVVNWWYDGDLRPFVPPTPFTPGYTPTPGLVEYRLTCLTSALPPQLPKAALVCIENTGKIPFALGFNGDALTAAERLVDTFAEIGETANSRNLLRDHYQRVELLVDTDCTKDRIRNMIVLLGRTHVVDLAVIGHGGVQAANNEDAVLIMHGGANNWATNTANLRESDVSTWKAQPDFQGLNLGLVYMMNCQGSKFSDAWLRLGFKTSVGSVGDDWMPEPMYSFFWQEYTRGKSAREAAESAWQRSKSLWEVIPGWNPTFDFRVTFPPHTVSLDKIDHARVSSSRLVVSGNSERRITDA